MTEPRSRFGVNSGRGYRARAVTIVRRRPVPRSGGSVYGSCLSTRARRRRTPFRTAWSSFHRTGASAGLRPSDAGQEASSFCGLDTVADRKDEKEETHPSYRRMPLNGWSLCRRGSFRGTGLSGREATAARVAR